MNANRAESLAWRWAIWIAFLLLWSIALLVPDPIGFLRRHAPVLSHFSHDAAFYAAKTLHVTAYALAAILTAWLHLRGRWRWLLLLFWFLHAGATEAGQLLV